MNQETFSHTELAFMNEELDRAERLLPAFFEKAAPLFLTDPKTVKVSEKGPGDFFTKIDKGIEQELKDWKEANFPNHGFLGEETGKSSVDDSDWLWGIDPVDGTTNWIDGEEDCSTVVSLRYKGVPVLAAVSLPRRNEFYFARFEKGVTRNGVAISPTKETVLKNVAAASSFINHTDRVGIMLGELWDEVSQVRIKNSVVQEVCDVATGKAGVGVFFRLEPYEWPAAFLIAKEAGCIIRPLDNLDEEVDMKGVGDKSFAIAGNQTLFDQIKHRVHLPPPLE